MSAMEIRRHEVTLPPLRVDVRRSPDGSIRTDIFAGRDYISSEDASGLSGSDESGGGSSGVGGSGGNSGSSDGSGGTSGPGGSLGDRISNLESRLNAASVHASCNGDGTITVVLTI